MERKVQRTQSPTHQGIRRVSRALGTAAAGVVEVVNPAPAHQSMLPPGMMPAAAVHLTPTGAQSFTPPQRSMPPKQCTEMRRIHLQIKTKVLPNPFCSLLYLLLVASLFAWFGKK